MALIDGYMMPVINSLESENWFAQGLLQLATANIEAPNFDTCDSYLQTDPMYPANEGYALPKRFCLYGRDAYTCPRC